VEYQKPKIFPDRLEQTDKNFPTDKPSYVC